MTTFAALYRGQTVGEARLVAVTAEPDVVEQIARYMLKPDAMDDAPVDPVLEASQKGREQALKIVAKGCRSSKAKEAGA